jgi:hypothetical protein
MVEQEERRREERARISLPVVIVGRKGDESVEMVNASFRGILIRMQSPPPVRQLVKMRIRLPSREVEIHGVVVRIIDEPTGAKGVGLRFFALNGPDRVDWEAFIAKLIPSRNLRAA